MPVDMELESELPPERIRAALIEFAPERPQLWPGIAPDLYEVYDVGETTAHVKEGSKLPLLGSFWAKELYDWSSPDTVRWTAEESNFSTVGSFMSATLSPRPGGGTRIQLHWERSGTTFVSQLICRMIVATKGKLVSQSFEKGLRQIEKRDTQQPNRQPVGGAKEAE